MAKQSQILQVLPNVRSRNAALVLAKSRQSHVVNALMVSCVTDGARSVRIAVLGRSNVTSRLLVRVARLWVSLVRLLPLEPPSTDLVLW
jgi:hypothetical protein